MNALCLSRLGDDMTTVNHFVDLAAINVNQHTEKKGKFTYLSWTYAVSEAMKADPSTTWAFRDPMIFLDKTMMVHCDVTMFGKSIYMFLPVMNNNKAIQNPDAFAINTAMMRCLTKAIAAHGLGIYIYAGEDLPEDEKQERAQVRIEAKPAMRSINDVITDISSAKTVNELIDIRDYVAEKPYSKADIAAVKDALKSQHELITNSKVEV